LQQGTTYQLVFEDLNIDQIERRRIAATKFTVVSEPKVVMATQTDHLYPEDKIKLSFDQAMEPTEDYLKFNLEGSGRWISDREYEFTPVKLNPGTTYSYQVLAGARSKQGGIVESDQTYDVSTPGAVTASITPGGGEVALKSQIRVNFDQPVDTGSAEARFSITPNVDGNFSWSGNSLVFTPVGFEYQTAYTVTMRAGVIPRFGLVSNRSFSGSFTTIVQTVRLNVPVYRQQYALSCEASALRMVLAYRGLFRSDGDILSHMGYAPRPRDTATNSWDDPNLMYVGDVSGQQNSSGYGAHAEPVAKAARNLGRSASTHTGILPSFLATKIRENRPVIIWGYGITPRLDAWNTQGGSVQAWLGEHTRVVVGVAGRNDNPVGFYINDPARGTQYYWTTAQLVSNLNYFGNLTNQAVVVD
jgi:uncharacterized protein YvpB